jgi:hypothetical protein
MPRKLVKILLVVAFIIVFGLIGQNDYQDRIEEGKYSRTYTNE